MLEKYRQAARRWNQVSQTTTPQKLRWWQSHHIIEHINRRFTSKPGIQSAPAGDIEALKARFPDQVFAKALSIGCGNAAKEIALLRSGIVSFFDCFEISDVRINQAKQSAAKFNLEQNIRIQMQDVLETSVYEEYDLVYWNNSLHHMLDTEHAVRWSRDALKLGGVFYMNDFVGPSKMQWSDQMLEIGSRVRAALPEKYLVNPRSPDKLLPRKVSRPNPQRLMEDDPTECADSDRILDAIRQYFPQAEIILTGGVIYHSALNDVLGNLDEKNDKHLLDLMLIIDDLCCMLGETHYGVAIAQKL